MKKYCAIFVFLASVSWADTTTNRLGLDLPTCGSQNWCLSVNGDFQILDATTNWACLGPNCGSGTGSGVVVPSTFTWPSITVSTIQAVSSMTVQNITINGTCTGSGCSGGSSLSGPAGAIPFMSPSSTAAFDNSLTYSSTTKTETVTNLDVTGLCTGCGGGGGSGIVSPGTFTWTNTFGQSMSTLTVTGAGVAGGQQVANINGFIVNQYGGAGLGLGLTTDGSGVFHASQVLADDGFNGNGYETSSSAFYQNTKQIPALAMNSTGSNWGCVENTGGQLWDLGICPTLSSQGTPILEWNGTTKGVILPNGYLQLYSQTKAQIKAFTPGEVGQQYYCNDCTTTTVCISTGTALGAFSQIQSPTTACN